MNVANSRREKGRLLTIKHCFAILLILSLFLGFIWACDDEYKFNPESTSRVCEDDVLTLVYNDGSGEKTVLLDCAANDKVCETREEITACYKPEVAEDGDTSDGDDVDGDQDAEEVDGDSEEVTDGDSTDGDVTDGDSTDGDATDGDDTDGDDTDGDATDGDVTDGDTSDGDEDVELDGDSDTEEDA